jgi:alpha-2-macroglobulin
MPRQFYFTRSILFALLTTIFTLFGAREAVADEEVSKKPLEIANAYVNQGWDGELPRIVVNFNRAIEDCTQLDESLIEIEPRPADGVFCRLSGRWQLQLTGKFEPSQYYRVTLKAGFPRTSAVDKTARALKAVVVVPDLESEAHLASKGTFFALHSPYWELPLSTTNISKSLTYRLSEVYPSVLVNFLDTGDERFTRPILEREVKPKSSVRNREQIMSLDLAECGVPRGKAGVYFMTIYSPEAYTERRYTLIVTDLAVFLTRVNGEMICNVRSLAHPERAVSGAQVQVYSHKQQLLAEATTDIAGEARIRIKPIADRDDYAELLIVREAASGDIAYVKFFGRGEVNGYYQEQALKPLCAAFTDRTLCRPGENVRATAILRGRAEGKPLAGVPLQATLNSPVAGELAKQVVVSDEFGVMQVDFALPPEALLGDWSVDFSVPGRNASVYGSANFQVAQFTPDQINADITAKYDATSRQLAVSGQAAYYFGTPVQGGSARIFVRGQYEKVKASAALRDYSFGCNDMSVSAFELNPVNVPLDDKGNFATTQELPEVGESPFFAGLPVRVSVRASIRGAGGTRPVTANASVLCHFAERYIGARVVSTDARQIKLSLKAVNTDGKETALPNEALSYKLEKIEWDYLLRSHADGTSRREWTKSARAVSDGALAVDADGMTTVEYPESGHYVVKIYAGEKQLWSNDVWCWMGEDEVRSPNPNCISFETNAEKYRPGEMARISFVSDFDGTALVYTAGGAKTPVESHAFAVKAGLNSFEVKVPEELLRSTWYVQVCVAGAIGEGGDAKRSADPQFISGVAELKIEQSAHHAHVALTLSSGEVARPGCEDEVVVQVTDGAGKALSAGEVVLWGVDEGVLAVAGMKTPDPFACFYGEDADPFKLSHIYDMLYPILRVVNGKIGGGDALKRVAAAALMADMHGRRNAQPLPPAVVYIGVKKLDAQGRCAVRFRYPQMSGSLRIMAVAVGADCVGCGEVNATVREPVTVSVLASAFAAPGDELVVRGSIFNHGEKALTTSLVKWNIVKGRVDEMKAETFPGTFDIASGNSAQTRFTFTVPSDSTDDEVRIRLTCVGADGTTSYSDTAVIAVRPAVVPRPRATTRVLGAGEQCAVTLSDAASDRLVIGSPLLRLQQHLDWLNNYPHGCLEQTTSAAFPQLAVPVLAKLGVVPSVWAEAAAEKVRVAHQVIRTMNVGDGAYAMWPNGTERWEAGTIYAILFQAEAKNAGMLDLASDEVAQMTSVLRGIVNNRSGKRAYSTDYALAVYALTLLSPEIGGQYAHLLPVEEDGCPQFVKFLAAMALIRGGYAAEGNQLWQSIRESQFAISGSDADGILDSPIRRTGLALWLLGAIMPEESSITQLTSDLDALCAGEDAALTTQEHAWLALGLARSAMLNKNALSGEAVATIAHGSETQTWRAASTDGYKTLELEKAGAYVIRNMGEMPIALTHYQRVANILAEPISSGFTIKREFLDMSGKPVTSFKVGDLLTIQITVSADETCENAVITDLLPAGMEIEDPKLATRMTVSAPRAPKDSEHVLTGARLIERCYDRLLWFGAIYKGAPRSYRYTVRCLAPAKCALPPTQVEDMYNPRHFALTPGAVQQIEIGE